MFSNRIDRRMLRKGDHIYCFRTAHTYSHHGIYVGDDRVIHFRRTEDSTSSRSQACEVCGFQPETQRGVVKSCLDCFLQGHRLKHFEYNVSSQYFMENHSGTCSTTSFDPPDIVYDLMKNNCENFARFCKTGVSKSLQAFSLKAKVKLVIRGLTEQSFSMKNTRRILAQVMVTREYKNDTLHYDKKKKLQVNHQEKNYTNNNNNYKLYVL
ncbi:hypothetical protein UlMin_024809 [Ulmus minor]